VLKLKKEFRRQKVKKQHERRGIKEIQKASNI
jgi:hypothetical protein